MVSLNNFYREKIREAGCDEAGRGCLAGPVVAAAVVLSPKNPIDKLNDSKQLTAKKRSFLRKEIEQKSESYGVAFIDPQEIDKINILNASFKAMHEAIKKIAPLPELLLIDGNRFHPFPDIPHQCFIKGDGRFTSIAAASILAKTYRDEFMKQIALEHPQYDWENNKGYATAKHREAVMKHALTPYHRKSFRLKNQLKIEF